MTNPPTSIAAKRTRASVRQIIRILKGVHPEATTALVHQNPLELLVATILSAQCTDVRVNIVTKDLFKKYRTAQEYASAKRETFERAIRSTGFYRAKTKSILKCAAALLERHGGSVPDSMEELIKLPGVGRKTANVVLGNAFGKSEGVVVDTHVKRLSGRLGLTKHTNPERIEEDLMQIVPKKDWVIFPHLLIWHGRKICRARKPLCSECPVSNYCPSAFHVQ